MDEQPAAVTEAPQQPTTTKSRWRPVWPRRRVLRWCFVGLYLLFLCGVAWGGWRLYWWLARGVPITEAIEVWDLQYPELRKSGAWPPHLKPDDGQLDVLLLGASSIEDGWSDVGPELQRRLEQEFGPRVRICNLSCIAHTSRDSWLKFSRVKDQPWDVVLIYDGVNDCRMNNCPPDVFRDDYTHCSWYLSFERRRAAGKISLTREMMEGTQQTIGLGPPSANNVQYGSDLKTPPAFRRNLESIVEAAQKQGAIVVLETFALYLPAGYSDEKLKARQLDFGNTEGVPYCPLEMWGTQTAVKTCVAAHNRIIQELARKYPQAVLIDQERDLPHDGRNFVDICHFTRAGSHAFVANVVPPLVAAIKEHSRDPAFRGAATSTKSP